MVTPALLVDCGNTRIKARYGNDDLSFEQIQSLYDWIAKKPVKTLIYADVSKRFDTAPEAGGLSEGVHAVEVDPGFNGLSLAYKDTSRLGVDRWLAMIGALPLQDGKGLIVVDAGTALKIDVIDSENRHIGGSIGPGLALSSDALAKRTALLEKVEITTDGFLGRDTDSCINYGIVIGAVALIERTVLKFCPNGTLLISGGDRNALSEHMSVPHQLVNNLVLDGLETYAEHLSPKVFE